MIVRLTMDPAPRGVRAAVGRTNAPPTASAAVYAMALIFWIGTSHTWIFPPGVRALAISAASVTGLQLSPDYIQTEQRGCSDWRQHRESCDVARGNPQHAVNLGHKTA